MRLIIETRKLTVELASNKHVAVDSPRAYTFASDTVKKDHHNDPFDLELLQSPTEEKEPPATSDTSIPRYTEPSRRKSIHKRIGRILLRISRMCSDTQCSAYTYRYEGAASELPAGGSPTDGTSSIHEMPGSFPRVELESCDMRHTSVHSRSSSMPYAQTTPAPLRCPFKENPTAMPRRAAPLSVTNMSQLPRLEVPQSQHCVPRLISDHSPLTPSPISPMTPLGGTTYGQGQSLDAQRYLSTISPCADSKRGQAFAYYGNWGNSSQLFPETPSTSSSYDPSYTTTPISAYPTSAHSSFQSWPPPQTERQLPVYSQAYLPTHHNQSMNDATLDIAYSWQNNVQFQAQYPNNTFPVFSNQNHQPSHHEQPQTHDPFPQAQSCFEKQSQIDAERSCPMFPQSSSTFPDVPPAYTPIVPDPQPPTPNTQHRYPPEICQHCGKVFTGKYGPGNCKRHVQHTHTSAFDRAIHICRVCMKTYNRADALRKHQWKKHRLEDARPNKRRERAS
ncbi:hypothetical protein OPT61_g2305 [Boeremia exigua]|uniref:Uncharacterized protein n=1 Tax=Boeremia exigua TaxID=749465 RepID=A0ACC2IM24_9PLEO|nr:hypothetical protein OPT61_g2305 [Boeremia exigua]